MNYQQALQIGGVDLNDKTRGSNTDQAISSMRAAAFFRSTSTELSQAIVRAGVKRRIAKRWSTRLLREGLLRSARLTGPLLFMLALTGGCGDPFALVCGAVGHNVDEPPATYPTGSAVAPIPPAPLPTATAPRIDGDGRRHP